MIQRDLSWAPTIWLAEDVGNAKPALGGGHSPRHVDDVSYPITTTHSDGLIPLAGLDKNARTEYIHFVNVWSDLGG